MESMTLLEQNFEQKNTIGNNLDYAWRLLERAKITWQDGREQVEITKNRMTRAAALQLATALMMVGMLSACSFEKDADAVNNGEKPAMYIHTEIKSYPIFEDPKDWPTVAQVDGVSDYMVQPGDGFMKIAQEVYGERYGEGNFDLNYATKALEIANRHLTAYNRALQPGDKVQVPLLREYENPTALPQVGATSTPPPATPTLDPRAR